MSMRVVSYGGGTQSTALLVLAARGEIDFPTFIFANTGDDSEYPGTLTYVREIALPYARKHGIEAITTQRTRKDGTLRTLYGDIMSGSERRVPIPVRLANGAPGNRSCTEEFKIRVVSRLLKKRGATKEQPATLGMGISIDELWRMRTDDSRFPHIHKEYPLVDLRLSRAACGAIIESAGLPVPPKSACYFCPFKKLSQWQELKVNEPELFDKAVGMERHINTVRAGLGKDEVWLSSALRPLDTLFTAELQGKLPFDEAEDGCTTDVCMT